MQKIYSIIAKFSSAFLAAIFAGTANAAEISIYTESFGSKDSPAILLNAGAGMQAITWPDKFCQQLAARGYFVIRYDYRDSGLSTKVDYIKNPYSILDLANDAINVLKKYHLAKAHFVGFSMGGQLAQLVGAYKPEYAIDLILISTSINFKPGFDACAGIYHTDGLSAPDKNYIAWIMRKMAAKPQTLTEKVRDYVTTWRMLDGNPSNFDADFFTKQAKQIYHRSTRDPILNQAAAMQATFKLHEEAPAKIQIPTLIIQGKKDPIYSPDHGIAMQKAIKNSKLLIWDDFGHAISPQNFNMLVEAIDNFIKEQVLRKI